MSEASKIYKRFSTEQKLFIKEAGINTKMSIPKWIKFLAPICRFDTLANNAHKNISRAAKAAAAATFFTLFISLFTEHWPLLKFGVPSLIVLTIILVIIKARYMLKDVNDNIRNVIYPLLEVLSLEVGHKQPVAMHINFNKPLRNEDVTEVHGENTRGRNTDKSIFYVYKVLEFYTTFLDNSRLQIDVIDNIRKRTRANVRGKLKTKIKLKRRIIISLSFDRAIYQLSPEFNNRSSSIVKSSISESKIKFRTMIKQSAENSIAELPLVELLNTIKTFYQHLNTVKTDQQKIEYPKY